MADWKIPPTNITGGHQLVSYLSRVVDGFVTAKLYQNPCWLMIAKASTIQYFMGLSGH